MDRETPEKTVPEAQQRRFLTRIWAYIIVLVFGVILSLGLWQQGDELPQTNQANWQVNQLESATTAFKNGQIIPQVNPDDLNGIGYGSLLFSGPLPSVLAAGIHFSIHSWSVTVNILATICLIGAGLTMCFALSKISHSHVLGAIGGIFYLTAPFLLTNIYVDFAIDELLALAIAPLFFWGLFRLINQESHAVRTLAIAFTLLLLTHSFVAALTVIVAIICLLCNLRLLLNLNSLWRIVLAIAVILGLSAFFTLPIIEAQLNCSYALFDNSAVFSFTSAETAQSSSLLTDFLLANSTPQFLTIGYVIIFGLISFWFIYTKIDRPAERNFLASLYLITIILIILNLPCFDWSFLPQQLQILGFPTQFLGIATLTGTIIASYSIYYIIKDLSVEKQKIGAILTGVLVLFACNPTTFFDAHTGQIENYSQNSDHETDNYTNETINSQYAARTHLHFLYAPTAFTRTIESLKSKSDEASAVNDENGTYKTPVDSEIQTLDTDSEILNSENTEINDTDSENTISKTLPNNEMRSLIPTHSRNTAENTILERPEILRGEAEIKNYSSTNHTLTVDEVTEETALALPILYYPGYTATLNNAKLEISIAADTGLLTIILPTGSKGLIQVHYGLSRATKLGGLLTLGTIALGTIWLIVEKLLSVKRSKDRAEAADIVESVREVLEFVEDDADNELMEPFDNANDTPENTPKEEEEPEPQPAPTKKRGRPRKKPASDGETNTKKGSQVDEKAKADQVDSEEVKPKKRGRPRKKPASDNQTAEKTT